jgi:integrase
MGWTVKAVPKIDRVTRQQVGWRYIFRAYNPAKRRNDVVPVEQIPAKLRECLCRPVNGEKNCSCLLEAEKFAKSKSAEIDAVKVRVLKLKEWQEKFHDFKELLDEFSKTHQVKAPNSWQNDVYYLETYVFPFFLGKQLSNNVQNWVLYYQQFKAHLMEVKPLKYTKENLAINTQNKIIKALNLFLAFLCETHPELGRFEKCSVYPKHMCNKATADDILEEHEIPVLYQALMDIRSQSAYLFLILVRTGMRINEALGLCLAFVLPGEISGKKSKRYHDLLQKYGLLYFGYICLESQPSQNSIRTEREFTDRFGVWSKGSVPRKPLKARHEIRPEYFRYIPLFDRQAWNVVVELYNQQLDGFGRLEHGPEERNYLLFDGMTASMFYSDLMKAFQATGLKPRPPHKIGRHTYATWFYDVTCEDPVLAERVVGHRDKATMDIYSHMAEQIGREQQQKVRGKIKLSLA